MSTEYFNFEINMDRLMSKYANKPFPDLGQALEVGLEKGWKDFRNQAEVKLAQILGDYGLLNTGIPRQIVLEIIDNGVSMRLVGEGSSAYNYAVFVEFGTGVVGERNPHPKAGEQGWVYDTKGHGESGWWYPSDASDPNPTLKLGENGWIAFTRGQASRPFMYDLWYWASRSTTQIVEKNIRAEFRRLERGFK